MKYINALLCSTILATVTLANAQGIPPGAPVLNLPGLTCTPAPAAAELPTSGPRTFPLTMQTMTSEELAAYKSWYNAAEFQRHAYEEAIRWKKTDEASKAKALYEVAAADCQQILSGHFADLAAEKKKEAETAAAVQMLDNAVAAIGELEQLGVKRSGVVSGEFQTQRAKWDGLSLDNKRRAALLASAIDQVNGGDGTIEIVDALSGTRYAAANAKGTIWTSKAVASSKSAAEKDLEADQARLENSIANLGSSSYDSGSEPAPAYVGPAVQDRQVYVLPGARTYHTRWCKLLKNKYQVMNYSVAAANGYHACSVCKP